MVWSLILTVGVRPRRRDRARDAPRREPCASRPGRRRRELQARRVAAHGPGHRRGDHHRRDGRHAGRGERRLPRPRRDRPQARRRSSTSAPRARSSSSCRCSRSDSRSRSPAPSCSPGTCRRRRFAGRRSTPSTPSRSPRSTSCIAVGLASFASSRVVVGVLIAWNAIVSHILISIHSARRCPQADRRARGRALPAARDGNAESRCRRTALLVLLVWAAVFLRPAAGGRTASTRRSGHTLAHPPCPDAPEPGLARRTRAVRPGRGPRCAAPEATPRRGRSCAPARSSSAPRRRRRGRCGPSRARSRGARGRAPSGRSARPAGSTFPAR